MATSQTGGGGAQSLLIGPALLEQFAMASSLAVKETEVLLA